MDTYDIAMLICAVVAALAALIAIYRFLRGKKEAQTSISVSKSPEAMVAGRDISIRTATSGHGDSGAAGNVEIKVSESANAKVGGRSVSKE